MNHVEFPHIDRGIMGYHDNKVNKLLEFIAGSAIAMMSSYRDQLMPCVYFAWGYIHLSQHVATPRVSCVVL
jgi:hypothetical protein